MRQPQFADTLVILEDAPPAKTLKELCAPDRGNYYVWAVFRDQSYQLLCAGKPVVRTSCIEARKVAAAHWDSLSATDKSNDGYEWRRDQQLFDDIVRGMRAGGLSVLNSAQPA